MGRGRNISRKVVAARRIGLVGCGRWGRNILRDLRELGARVHVADPDPDARGRAQGEGAASVASEVTELPDADGFVVAAGAAAHAALVAELLPRGRPVFVEKPFTVDPADARRLAAEAPDRIFVMDKWRYHPGVEALSTLGRSGELGAILGCRSLRFGGALKVRDVDSVWTLAPHELSLGLELLGGVPEAREAHAEGARDAPTGLAASLGEAPWQCFEVSAARSVYRREVELIGERGRAALLDPYADHISVRIGPGAGQQRAIETEPPLRRELRAFLGHLDGGPPPRTRAEDGATVVARLWELRRLAGLSG